ncbi:MAG: hypothetical protein AAF995_05860 [Planctomycetota bacterium]
MIDTLQAGQEIRCTVDNVPQNKGGQDTICRLMRRNPDFARGLRRAQHLRSRRMNRYIRGNRLWSSREKAARVVKCAAGASWTMTYTHDIASDLGSVSSYLKIEQA